MATFNEFWAAYPKRKGSRAIAEAEKRFNKAVKNGADADHIISSAHRFHDEAAEQGNIDTPFIPLASTWLNQRRWLDYAPVVPVDPATLPPMDPRWIPIRNFLLLGMAEDVVVAWMDKLTIVSEDGPIGQLKAPSKFIQTWVKNKYSEHLNRAWMNTHQGSQGVEISL